ncbi:hypothetical protein SteCoe_11655 [Stentor coeruleus]|uniref:Tubulin-specific chaperone A n=1 Tax=Stentor coeruleus TaxID=5963 RepID=A0A1R2CCQ8_9CILI|nr:hypothetical protein SteCoe_11655 [Stentor coeruleus]
MTREHESFIILKNLREKDCLEKLRDKNAEECIIRKQEEIIQESIQMISNTNKRLQNILEELNIFMKENDTQQEFILRGEWTEANNIHEQARNAFNRDY